MVTSLADPTKSAAAIVTITATAPSVPTEPTFAVASTTASLNGECAGERIGNHSPV
jgi:hypothetical protein